jgi:hypothetical protein
MHLRNDLPAFILSCAKIHCWAEFAHKKPEYRANADVSACFLTKSQDSRVALNVVLNYNNHVVERQVTEVLK